MEKSLIKERVEKIKQCPNCKATEEFGKFELIRHILSKKASTVTEEECPSCGAHVFFSNENKPHTITIEELFETSNDFRKILMICPELNTLVRDYLTKNKEKSTELAM